MFNGGYKSRSIKFSWTSKIKNLVLLFDNNSISIDGPTSLAVSDDHEKDLKAMAGIT